MKNHFLTVILLVATLLSCTTKKQEQTENAPENSYFPPTITRVADLPDSLKPEVIDLSERPEPRKIIIPQDESSRQSYIGPDGEVIQLKPPEKKLPPAFEGREEYLEKLKEEGTSLLAKVGVPHHTAYTTDDGLPMNWVSCATVDKRGHIWFGTWGGGISRFDGIRFTNYSVANGMPSNLVTSIMEDQKGNIWIGTLGQGLCRYDGIKFTFYSNYKQWPPGAHHIQGITEGNSEKIWAISKAGIQYYTPEEDSVIHLNVTFPDSKGNDFTCLEADKLGDVWLGSNNGAICFNPANNQIVKRFSTENGLADNVVNDIHEDLKGRIWFATGNGVSCYQPDNKNKFKNYTVTHAEGITDVLNIHENSKGKLWFGIGDGDIGYLVNNGTNEIFTDFHFPTSSPLLLIDSSDRLWFGTWSSGLLCMNSPDSENNSSFSTFSEDEGFSNNYITGIYHDSKGHYWFKGGGFLARFDSTHFTYYTSVQGLPYPEQDLPYYSDIIGTEDLSGRIWFGGHRYTGGYSYFPSSNGESEHFTFYGAEQEFNGNFVAGIEDDSGNMWFSNWGNNLIYYDGETVTKYTEKQGLVNNLIADIAEDKNGNIWFGTAGNRLNYFNLSNGGIFVSGDIERRLQENLVNDLMIDTIGNLWAATGNGLKFLDAGTIKKINNSLKSNTRPEVKLNSLFKTFTTEDGLPVNSITNIAELRRGKIAIGSSEGLTIFDYPVDSTDGFSSIRNVETFNVTTGFPVRHVNNSNNNLHVDNDGILWIACVSKKAPLIRFDYDALYRKNKLPALTIQQVKINEEAVAWQTLGHNKDFVDAEPGQEFPSYTTEETLTYGKALSQAERENLQQKFKGIDFSSVRKFYSVPEDLVIPNKHNRVTIDYGTNELIRPQLVEYQYKLEGYDDDWSPVLKNTSASFGNITEGDYTFLVKARYTGPSENGADNWTEPVSYTFTVLPPWYRSILAYVFYVIIFLLGVWQVHQFQKARTIRAEREKAQQKELEHAKEIKKAYHNLEVAHEDLETAHENLKSTQAQLIQSEKMASLGELTAGIAHEIQNPLNFVNNFSEVNNELIEDLKEAIANNDQEEIEAILYDLKENESKVSTHGKRAESIVKGMLLHSRGSSGKKEPTDINALCDEYLRLAFHGFRAKDKSFNADFKLEVDESLPKINVVPQDIGRVLLNLINNAFYVVNKKAKENIENYKPEVTVSISSSKSPPGDSRLPDGQVGVKISVEDNGPGIPDSIKDKIFQPFFTTKSTGEGTGLGLSMSYDIITKGHGGELKFETKEGEGSVFMISLWIT